MTRLTLAVLLLAFASTPALSSPAPASQASTPPGQTSTDASQATMPSVGVDQQPKSVALAGRLIYQEIELPETAPSAGNNNACDPVPGPTDKPAGQVAGKSLLAKQLAIAEALRMCGCRWLGLLRSLPVDLALRKLGIMDRSWVAEVNEQQSLQVAEAIAAYLAKQAPAESTIVLLAPPPKAQAANPLASALSDSLRKLGFGLVESQGQAPDAHVLRYQVRRLSGGLFVQLQFNQIEANRFYCLDASRGLVAESPFCVREVR